jgi:hypothetical protein
MFENKFTEPVDETVNTDYTANRDENKDYSDIADINVGYISAVSKKTIERVQSLDGYLQQMKNGTYKETVENYRAYISNKMPVALKSDDARNQKAATPCCVPHSNSTTLSVSNKLSQNGLMQVDVDRPNLGNLYVSEEQITAALNACPYIFAYHKSIGNEGYVGYAYTTDPISESFWVVADDLQSRDLHVDLSKGSGTGEKRFMSYDPDLVIKEQFTPVKSVVWHRPNTSVEIRRKTS